MKMFKKYEHSRLHLIASFCSGKTALDLGYAQLPNPYLKTLHSVGLDLQKPKRNNNENIDSSCYNEELIGDITKVNTILSGRLFDNIIAGEFIEHIENPYEFVRSLKPLLAKNGRLIISTPNPLSFPVILCEAFRNKKYFYTEDHKYYFTPRWVERILESCGFKVIKVKGVGIWNPLISIPAPSTLSYQVIYVAVIKEKMSE